MSKAYYTASALCALLGLAHTGLGPGLSKELKQKAVSKQASGFFTGAWYEVTGMYIIFALQNYRFAVAPPITGADALIQSGLLAFTGVFSAMWASKGEALPAGGLALIGGTMAYARFA